METKKELEKNCSKKKVKQEGTSGDKNRPLVKFFSTEDYSYLLIHFLLR